MWCTKNDKTPQTAVAARLPWWKTANGDNLTAQRAGGNPECSLEAFSNREVYEPRKQTDANESNESAESVTERTKTKKHVTVRDDARAW